MSAAETYQARVAQDDRMAAGERIGIAVKGTDGTTFNTGRATRGVALARRCLSSFR